MAKDYSRRAFLSLLTRIGTTVTTSYIALHPPFGLAQSRQTASAHSKLYARVVQLLVEQLGIDSKEIKPSSICVDDLGVDSLDSVELVMAFEEAFEVEISDEDIGKMKTVEDTVRLIERLQKVQKAKRVGK